jgi:hypothetical protein
MLSELDENVLAFDVTQFSEPRPHCLHAGCGSSSGAERQIADTRYFGRLVLRVRASGQVIAALLSRVMNSRRRMDSNPGWARWVKGQCRNISRISRGRV